MLLLHVIRIAAFIEGLSVNAERGGGLVRCPIHHDIIQEFIHSELFQEVATIAELIFGIGDA